MPRAGAGWRRASVLSSRKEGEEDSPRCHLLAALLQPRSDDLSANKRSQREQRKRASAGVVSSASQSPPGYPVPTAAHAVRWRHSRSYPFVTLLRLLPAL
ncbi:hypothetical protein MTO96_020800 [Rhipicephalus appendiculatus]